MCLGVFKSLVAASQSSLKQAVVLFLQCVFFPQDFISLSEGWGVGQQMPGCAGNPMRAQGCQPEQKAHVTTTSPSEPPRHPHHHHHSFGFTGTVNWLCCHLMFYMMFSTNITLSSSVLLSGNVCGLFQRNCKN